MTVGGFFLKLVFSIVGRIFFHMFNGTSVVITALLMIPPYLLLQKIEKNTHRISTRVILALVSIALYAYGPQLLVAQATAITKASTCPLSNVSGIDIECVTHGVGWDRMQAVLADVAWAINYTVPASVIALLLWVANVRAKYQKRRGSPPQPGA